MRAIIIGNLIFLAGFLNRGKYEVHSVDSYRMHRCNLKGAYYPENPEGLRPERFFQTMTKITGSCWSAP